MDIPSPYGRWFYDEKVKVESSHSLSVHFFYHYAVREHEIIILSRGVVRSCLTRDFAQKIPNVSHIPHEIAHIYNSTPLHTPAFTFRVDRIYTNRRRSQTHRYFYTNFPGKRAEVWVSLHVYWNAHFARWSHSDDTHIIASYQMFFKSAIKLLQALLYIANVEISIL